MRFVTFNMFFAVWLMISAFALGHSAASAILTWVAAVAVGAVALAAHGKPALRYFIPIIAIHLAVAALFLADVSAAGRINNAIVAAILFAVSVVQPRAARAGSAAAAPQA